MFPFSSVRVFSTTGSEVLAAEICESLKPRLPDQLIPRGTLELGETNLQRFSNENIQIQVDNVRGHFVVVIHTQTPPVNEGLIELFALLDAINNSRPADVLLVFPYMPYARSDRKNKPRISTMGCCLARIISQSFNIKRVILLDPHDSHVKHYFDPAADEISTTYLLIDYLEREVFSVFSREESVVVFSDPGSAIRYKSIAYLLHLPTAYIEKDRPDDSEKPKFSKIVGNVENKHCLLIDDEILTGATAVGDAKILKTEGASSIIMLAAHSILRDKNIPPEVLMQTLTDSPIEKFIVTNTIPQEASFLSKKFKVLSVAPFLGEAIKRSILGQSLTELHKMESVKHYR
jgi:ribose-phosphate pyrophosphokinase